MTKAIILTLALLLGIVQTAQGQTSPVIEYYHLDGVGSVRAVTNESGQVVRRYDYFAFGEGDGVVAGEDPVRFTGQERDAETGLDYFGARYYRSRGGRFTSVDPAIDLAASIRNPQHWNRYAYVANNPVRWTDPDGRCVEVLSCTWTFGTAGAVVGGPVGGVVAAGVGALVGGAVVVGTWALLRTPPSTPTRIEGVNAPLNVFSPKVKAATDKAAGGTCEYCGVDVVPAEKSKAGVKPSRDERQTDHYDPQGGDDAANAVNSCRSCNREKSNTKPEGTKWELERMKKKQPSEKNPVQ